MVNEISFNLECLQELNELIYNFTSRKPQGTNKSSRWSCFQSKSKELDESKLILCTQFETSEPIINEGDNVILANYEL